MRQDASNDRADKRLDSEHARIVAEVLEDQARRRAVRASKTGAVGDSDTSFFVQVGLLVAGTFFFYLLFFSPTWIAPTRPDPISAQAVEDGLRVAIYRTATEIQSFRNQEGRLPRTIEEVSGPRDGVEYQQIDTDTFVVQATTGQTTLRYVSTESLPAFVGDTFERMLGGTS